MIREINLTDLGEPQLQSRGVLTPIVAPAICSDLMKNYIEKIAKAYNKASYPTPDIDAETKFYLFPRKSDGRLIFDIYTTVTTANGQADTTLSGVDFTENEIRRILDYIGSSNAVKSSKTARKWHYQYLRDLNKNI